MIYNTALRAGSYTDHFRQLKMKNVKEAYLYIGIVYLLFGIIFKAVLTGKTYQTKLFSNL